MKKRAIVSAVAGIALAGVMAVGFAACGGSAKSIKGDEVSKETWETAMDVSKYDNYKAAVVSESVTTMGEVTVTVKVDCTITYVDGAQHIKGKSKTTVKGDLPDDYKDYYKAGDIKLDYYISKDGDVIAQKDGKWTKIGDDASESEYPVDAEMVYYFIPDANFDSYEYKKDQKGYVLKGEKDGNLHVVKIKDGKLKAVYMETKNGITGMESSSTVDVVLTHGGQKVEVPSVD